MKIIFFVLAVFFSSTALAGDSGFYLGVKGGNVLIIGQEPLTNLQDASLSSIVAGYKFSPWVGVEYQSGYSEHEESISNRVLNLETNAVYLTLSSHGKGYFKLKAGLLNEKILNGPTGTVSDSGLSIGGGVGVDFGRVSLEAEYIIIERDAQSVGASVLFNF